MALRNLTEAEVTFEVTCHDENFSYVGNCSAIDEETDRQQEEWVRSQLDSGNEWAWCRVEVVAKWKDFESDPVHLGGCSYLSEADFCQPGGYYDDMKAEALDDLNERIREHAESIAELIV